MGVKSLKEREEEKRDRHWDPAERWRVIQETITWAESQAAVKRSSPANRLREQALKRAAHRA